MQQSITKERPLANQCDYGRQSLDTERVHYLGMYHKYWIDKKRRIKNNIFDTYSANILGLKRGKITSIRYFYSLLGSIIPHKTNLMICVVPSSNPCDKNPGIKRLARALAKNNGLIDGTDVLIRTKKIQKLAEGGERSRGVHYRSIAVKWENACQRNKFITSDDTDPFTIPVMMAERMARYLEILAKFLMHCPKPSILLPMNDLRVLLIDDVTTSGNSLRACRDILLQNGAKKVYMLALGRTATENEISLDKNLNDNCNVLNN